MVVNIKTLPTTSFVDGDAVPVERSGAMGKIVLGDLATRSIPETSTTSTEGDTLLAVRAGELVRLTDGIDGDGDGAPVLDEDDFASNSATQPPSQQSAKAYVDAGLATKADTSHTHEAADISDATATGLAVLTAADDEAAGTLYETSLIASTLIADGSYLRRVGSSLVGQSLGSAALLSAIPSGAPTTASSTAGAITLNFAGKEELSTTTTENITSITFQNIAAYSRVLWNVTQTTARNITFPAGTIMKGNGGLLLYTGTANSEVTFVIWNKGGTYVVQVGDAGVVGA